MNFVQVEEEVKRLRGELKDGRLGEGQFKARLKELMVQDEAGDWWMIGYETDQWYRHDGQAWVRGEPPGYRRPDPAEAATRGGYRLNFWRGAGLVLLAAVIYDLGNWAFASLFDTARYPVWPFDVAPPLFGMLFGPWVGGFSGALALFTFLLRSGIEGGGLWGGTWAVTLAAFVWAMLPAFLVKDPGNWKQVMLAGFVYTTVFVILYIGILSFYEGTSVFDPANLRAYAGMLVPNLVLQPFLARWLNKPVRRAGLFWRERSGKAQK